jgi:hypothetical protein
MIPESEGRTPGMRHQAGYSGSPGPAGGGGLRPFQKDRRPKGPAAGPCRISKEKSECLQAQTTVSAIPAPFAARELIAEEAAITQ